MESFMSSVFLTSDEVADIISLYFPHGRWWNKLVSEDLVQVTKNLPESSSPLEAINALSKSGSTVLTIVDDKGSLSGIFTADNARRRLAHLSGSTAESFDKFTVKKFYTVDLSSGPTLGSVSRILDIAPYVIVVNTDGQHVRKPVGYLTSEDLLAYVTNKSHQMNGK